ncbi:hypothetical protein HYC85_025214 [Camellia sinensis]|uniref:YDG domain-containing protein n=1 Tax=Camellia sinensis TaxID=4442 RepID=A0A7J7GE43_CAMSI|nr:hypothetical protein HYC85_025214 [Camellia sinensis]
MVQSVALSGGYEDDEDHGEWFLYTGRYAHGCIRYSKIYLNVVEETSVETKGRTRQSFDQKFDKMNEALRVSCRKGYPVQVVRAQASSKQPPSSLPLGFAALSAGTSVSSLGRPWKGGRPVIVATTSYISSGALRRPTPCLPSAIPERFAGGLSCQGMTIRLTGCGLCQYGNTNPGFTGAPFLTIRPSAYSDP